MSKHERRRPNPPPEIQMSFLSPSKAELTHMLLRFIAEASKLYEFETGEAAADALRISHPQDAYEFLRLEMESLEQAQPHTISLNTRSRIISSVMIYQGSVHTTVVRIAEIFRPAIRDNTTAIIIAHNHPSGESSPSPEDVSLTAEPGKAGNLLGIDVLDHLVIGRGNPGFGSLKERGFGFGH